MANPTVKLHRARILLTNDNFSIWKITTRGILMEAECEKYIDHPEPDFVSEEPNSAKAEKWKTDNRKVLGFLIGAVEAELLHHIASASSAYEAWEKLRSLFERSTLESQLTLLRKLMCVKYDQGSTMQEYINKILVLVQRLRDAGETPDEKYLHAILLNGLPDEYEEFRRTMDALDKSQVTFKNVSDKLLDAYERMKEQGKLTSLNSAASFASTSSSYGSVSKGGQHLEGPGHHVSTGASHGNGYKQQKRGGRGGRGSGHGGHRGSHNPQTTKGFNNTSSRNYRCYACGSYEHIKSKCPDFIQFQKLSARFAKVKTSSGEDKAAANTAGSTAFFAANSSKQSTVFCKKRVHVSSETGKQALVTDSVSDPFDKRNCVFGEVSCSAVTRKDSKDFWLVDSGASSHMTCNRTIFIEYNQLGKPEGIQIADGNIVQAVGIGKAKIFCNLPDGRKIEVTLQEVLYIPELNKNLLSLGRITNLPGRKVIFEGKMCIIEHNGQVVAVADKVCHVYKLNCTTITHQVGVANAATCVHEWHRRLGHRDIAVVKKLVAAELVNGVKFTDCNCSDECECCARGKMVRKSFRREATRANKAGERFHTDLCGPMQVPTAGGRRYVLTITDDYSRYTTVHLLTRKDQTAEAIMNFLIFTENQHGKRPKSVRSDNGREFIVGVLTEHFKKLGILHETTVPYTPEQNGVAERKNRTIMEMVRCMLIDSNLPQKFWGEAVIAASELINKLPSRTTGCTPYELWFEKKPDLSRIRIFGAKAYSHIPDQQRRKLDDKGRPGVIVSYDEQKRSYRLLDPVTGNVFDSHTVRIFEEMHELPQSSDQKGDGEQLNRSSDDRQLDDDYDDGNSELEEDTKEGSQKSDGDNDSDSGDSEKDRELSVPVVTGTMHREYTGSGRLDNVDQKVQLTLDENVHPEPTRRSQRLNKGILPIRYRHEASLAIVEPTSWDDIFTLPMSEQKRWIQAAEEEMQSLEEHDVFELVTLPTGRRAITSKWIFKAKLDGDGNVHTHKARLVARGFAQRKGTDYEETFAPVVRYDTVRTLLAVAALKKLHVRHLDVKCAYLNGELREELYMEQPDGFVRDGNQDKVFRLKRSIYGLKQSAHTWNKTATSALSKLNFQQSKADQCLFARKEKDGSTTYVLIYVDDLLVAAKTQEMAIQIGKVLDKSFKTKDLGEVRQYLGIQIERNDDGSFLLNQRTKIIQLIEEHNLLLAKKSVTPMEVGYLASVTEPNECLPNNKQYRQAIGSLLYLATVSRPDISLAVGFLARSVEKPTQSQWKAVQRVMRYLLGTANLKMLYSSKGTATLECYTDADWAGNREDRKSTSGYVFQLGGSTIAWSSRKQSTVALSSTEAEYISASHAAQEVLWLRQLLKDMHLPPNCATVVHEDNQGCIKMIESNRSSQRTKHIDVRYHMLRDLHDKEVIKTEYCPSSDMRADVLTKPLGRELHSKFVVLLGLQ